MLTYYVLIFLFVYLDRMKRGRKNSKSCDPVSDEENIVDDKKTKTLNEESAEALESPDWGNLIPDIVLQVFQYLPLLDRAHASQVCRQWNQVFHMPELWRCFEFELNQPATSYLKATHPELIKQIIKRHSNHLQYVSFKVMSSFRKLIILQIANLGHISHIHVQPCYVNLISGLVVRSLF